MCLRVRTRIQPMVLFGLDIPGGRKEGGVRNVILRGYAVGTVRIENQSSPKNNVLRTIKQCVKNKICFVAKTTLKNISI